MSETSDPPTAPKSYAVVLVVSSVPASIDWYTDKIGLEEGFRWGDPVTFGGVCRGDVTIHLQAASETDRPIGGSCLNIFVDDVMAWHARLVAAGVSIHVSPSARDYGLIDFSTSDPDGNTLVFASDVEA